MIKVQEWLLLFLLCSIFGIGYWTLKYVLQMALKVEVVVNCN